MHIENAQRSSDHLYLEACTRSARSETGFKVSVLRGTLRFQLTRSYVAKKIEVEMVGFKSVRLSEKGNVNMNSAYEVRDMSERLCCITWNLGEDVELTAGKEYVYNFSALLDARIPRSIKAGSSRVYYRLSANIPNLRTLKTETALTIPWSRSSRMAADASDDSYDTTIIPIEQDGNIVLELPHVIIKGPDRSMTLRLHPNKSAAELHITHIDIEVLQNVTLRLERLVEPHQEPSVMVQSAHADFPANCSKDNPLLLTLPLPAVIHPEMNNPHIAVSHVLKVVIHRAGLRPRKTHKQKIVLHYLDADLHEDAVLPMYEDVITPEHNDPEYEYNALARHLSEVQQNVL